MSSLVVWALGSGAYRTPSRSIVRIASCHAPARIARSDLDRNLLDAVKQNDVGAVQQVIGNGANVNQYSTETPLIIACQRGYADILRILLDEGANARWKDYEGRSAICLACREGQLSIVEMLLNHDHRLLEIADNDGSKPLLMAIYSRQVDIVQFLVSRGANIHATTDRNGVTALMHACWSGSGNIEVVRLLLAARADPHARDHQQRTPLHYAGRGRQSSVESGRELIEQHNADMLAVDEDGDTPFDVAARSSSPGGVVDYLLQVYGNKMTQDHGRHALHVILRSAVYSFVEEWGFRPPLLPLRIHLPLGKLKLKHFRSLLHYLDTWDTEVIRKRDKSGNLPIHIACEANAPVEIFSLLVGMNSATLQIADRKGSLPIHLLCCCGTTPTDDASVRYLVEQEGGVGTLVARNHKGALPLHNLVASTNPTLTTVQYLIQSFPGAVTARTADEGLYPFMVAACDTSSASLSVVYELARANPSLVLPR